MEFSEAQLLKAQKNVDLLLLGDGDTLRKLVKPLSSFPLSRRTDRLLRYAFIGNTQYPEKMENAPYKYVGDIARESDSQLLNNPTFGIAALGEVHHQILNSLNLSNPVIITGWPDRLDVLHDLIIDTLADALVSPEIKRNNEPPTAKPSRDCGDFDLTTARGRLMALNLPKSLRHLIR